MTLFWALVMWLPALPVLPILYFMQKNECKPKKNIIVGVTLPWEGQRDERVLALLERFKKEMKIICWVMLAAVVPTLFIKSFGVFMTIWLTWTVLLCFIFFIPYARCNKALKQIKDERGWRLDAEETAQVVTDLRAAAEEMRWLSPWWFLPPFFISLVPLLFDRTVWWLWVIEAALVPLFYLAYRDLYRNRAEVVDEDTSRTLALTRVRRYNWGKCWIIMAWVTGIFNIGLWLTLDHIWLCMAVVLIYGFVVCAVVISIEFRVRGLQEKLTAGSGRIVDEDDRWIWGLFYYDPNDARMIVNNRVGMNTTFNMARRPAQIIMGLALVMLLACPLIGVWTLGMERAPVELEVTEDALTGSHYGGHWSVALEVIAEIEVIEDRPRLSRIAGTGMDNALTGKFSADGWGQITCCIDPRTGPWLKVTAVDGQIFLFGSSEEGVVETVSSLLPVPVR